ncbi:MAG: glycosyltransferase family 39 protein [Anaerolineales bacterium]|nr:glycosyltransferase family 39 protein [Anaerolineales bacterium]
MLRRIQGAWVAMGSNRTYQLVILAFITAIAAGLRFYKLGEWGFWGDEYITVRKALDVFGGGITRQSPFMLSTHLVLNSLGVSEWSARLVSTIVGIITIPIFFLLVKRLFDVHVAVIAALFLAIAPWHIYWSQNARFYTTMLLFYTAALLFFHWALEENRRSFMIVSLLFFGLAAFERLLAGFLVPIFIGYIILLKIGRFSLPKGLNWRNLAIYFVPGLIGVVGIVLATPTFQDAERAARSFGFTNANPFWIVSGVLYYVGIPFVCMSLFGAFSLILQRNRIGLLLSVAATVPTAVLMITSLIQYTANRYAFVSLTAIIILAAYAVNELLIQMPSEGKIFAVGAFVILLAVSVSDNVLYYQFQHGNRDNWKDAFALVSSQYQEGDQIITANRALADYYLGKETLGMQSVEVVGLETILDDAERTWFVIDVTAVGKGPTSTRWAQEHAHFMGSFDVNISARTFPMAVYLYDAGVQE